MNTIPATDPYTTDPYVEVHVTVCDRWGNVTTAYVGSTPVWAWEAGGKALAQWKAVRRCMVLEDRTSDPKGWRVVFKATYPDPV